ncbi:MAG TPA: alkaline phosphatase family protein [Bryobacteraceae bacterium]|jgi:hypothetical protein|nr:alkaline phosphatase family protein [Bryobacteraceae bacterium]
MNRLGLAFAAALLVLAGASAATAQPAFRRVVIVKVDGLNADLLNDTIHKRDPATGRSVLPWISRVFDQDGVVFDNFYVRGISLSAPSWSLLDTGRHTIIRGNAEFDRYTGQVYDYLNVFPFYLGYARNRAVDMPGVEVLDSAGIPLLIDRFAYAQVFQSFQLFQRGVSWTTLKDALFRSFSGQALRSVLESAAPISLSSSLSRQLETELEAGLRREQFLYLDFFTGDADHVGHATSDPQALLQVMREIDALVGRIATTIRQSPLARETLLVMVSDHGMNNTPGVISQTFNLPDLFGRSEGGGHHVVTNREQLSDYKLKGINPLVHRVITPSAQSIYLAGEASHYPTAWIDIDGNERAAVHLRNSDLNKIHILLLELSKSELTPEVRRAAADSLQAAIDKHRAAWNAEADGLRAELDELARAIETRKSVVKNLPKSDTQQHESGEDKANRRLRLELEHWEREHSAYRSYLSHLDRLLAFHPDSAKPFKGTISNLIPELTLGDNNSVGDLERYIVGPSAGGLVLTADGHLDEEKSFRRIDYFALLASQRARNNPQTNLSQRPIDFVAMALPHPQRGYWLYRDADHQLIILEDTSGRLRVQPVRDLTEDSHGVVHWQETSWCAGLPLELYEDEHLQVASEQRASWLSQWHTEQEWMRATYACHYSNAVIGIPEELSPVAPNVPGRPGISPLLLRYERRRRELVQADFHVFAADHWNFNARFPNPGGNHGSFLRISTHSVWMMAGGDLGARHIEEPYDSLNFASTVLNLLGKEPPMPDRVVTLR